MSKKEEVQRLTAEQLFQEEIDALIKAEKNPISISSEYKILRRSRR